MPYQPGGGKGRKGSVMTPACPRVVCVCVSPPPWQAFGVLGGRRVPGPLGFAARQKTYRTPLSPQMRIKGGGERGAIREMHCPAAGQVDGKTVGKTEVQNLLESAGFSRANPYNVVRQGEVMKMATLRDPERLELLKEIGGTKARDGDGARAGC